MGPYRRGRCGAGRTALMTAEIVQLRIGDAAEAAVIDDYIAGRADVTPFHRPAWMRAVERACGHRAYYLASREGNVIRGVLPLHDIRSPLFGRALVSAGFAVGGGVLADSEEAAWSLCEAAWDLACELGCPSLELRAGALPSAPCWHIDRETYAGFVKPLASRRDRDPVVDPTQAKGRSPPRARPRSRGFDRTRRHRPRSALSRLCRKRAQSWYARFPTQLVRRSARSIRRRCRYPHCASRR